MGVQDCCTTRSIEPGLMGWGEIGVREGERRDIGESYEWRGNKKPPIESGDCVIHSLSSCLKYSQSSNPFPQMGQMPSD